MTLSLKIQTADGAARRRPEDIELVIHAHGHFDRVGVNGIIAERVAPRFFAHPEERAIIENLDYQVRIRPVGNIRAKNTSGPVKMDGVSEKGDKFDLGESATAKEIVARVLPIVDFSGE